jgi:P pilus assembly chaperone PapD
VLAGAAAAVWLAFQAVAAHAAGYNVAPLRYDLAPMGPEAAQRLHVRNTGDAPVTLSVVVERLSIDRLGDIAGEPEMTDIVVFPLQMVVRPGGTQVVQVRYVGDGQIERARLYSVTFEQVPVDLETNSAQAQFRVATRYRTAAVVAPRDAKPSVAVSKLRREGDALRGVATNRGDGAALLPAALWAVTLADGRSVRLQHTEVDYGRSSFLLPGASREFSIPVTLLGGGTARAVELVAKR